MYRLRRSEGLMVYCSNGAEGFYGDIIRAVKSYMGFCFHGETVEEGI